MLRLAFDENFNNDVLRGLLRCDSSLDIVRVQDAGLQGADDLAVLSWAAEEGRVLVSHDVATLTAFAYARITDGQPMPGLIEVAQHEPIAKVIQDLLLIAHCGEPADFEAQVLYLPLH
jgi:hypothetical protein